MEALTVLLVLGFYIALAIAVWKVWKFLKPFVFDAIKKTRKEVGIDRKSIDKLAWKIASDEVRDNQLDDALWAKSFTEAGGDGEQQKAVYLSLRQKEIYDVLLQKERQER